MQRITKWIKILPRCIHTRSSHEKAFCQSVCPSFHPSVRVCQTRGWWQNERKFHWESSAQISVWTRHVHVRYAIARPAVCLSCVILRRLKFSAMFSTPFGNSHPLSSICKILRISFQGTVRRGRKGVNARRVAKYSDFGPVERYISEIVLISNRKSHGRINFWLVSKSVTFLILNGVIARTLRYSAEFGSIRGRIT